MVEISLNGEDITPSETAKEPNQISNEEDPVSILIVEDNVELRNFLSDILSRKLSGTHRHQWTRSDRIGLSREYIPRSDYQ